MKNCIYCTLILFQLILYNPKGIYSVICLLDCMFIINLEQVPDQKIFLMMVISLFVSWYVKLLIFNNINVPTDFY